MFVAQQVHAQRRLVSFLRPFLPSPPLVDVILPAPQTGVGVLTITTKAALGDRVTKSGFGDKVSQRGGKA